MDRWSIVIGGKVRKLDGTDLSDPLVTENFTNYFEVLPESAWRVVDFTAPGHVMDDNAVESGSLALAEVLDALGLHANDAVQLRLASYEEVMSALTQKLPVVVRLIVGPAFCQVTPDVDGVQPVDHPHEDWLRGISLPLTRIVQTATHGLCPGGKGFWGPTWAWNGHFRLQRGHFARGVNAYCCVSAKAVKAKAEPDGLTIDQDLEI